MSANAYLNPYPNYPARYNAPYTYPGTSRLTALRWGLSRGALSDELGLTAIVPDTGVAAGGDVVILEGTGFRLGMTVTFGGAAATVVRVLSSARAIVTTPAHAAGAVDVVVTNPDGDTDTLLSGFTYT